jgi:hypothetical protein
MGLVWLLGIPLPIIFFWFFFGAKKYGRSGKCLRPYALRFEIKLTKIQVFSAKLSHICHAPKRARLDRLTQAPAFSEGIG